MRFRAIPALISHPPKEENDHNESVECHLADSARVRRTLPAEKTEDVAKFVKIAMHLGQKDISAFRLILKVEHELAPLNLRIRRGKRRD